MDDLDSKLRDRASLVRLILISGGVITGVVWVSLLGWRLFNAEWKLDVSGFRFTDLLSLVLALFSVWLSVAFYHKATETSNTFYDNTFRFTKEISEILGRIEAGFGERLRHLDEGYSGLATKFDRFPLDLTQAREDIAEEEKEVAKKEAERNKLIEDLAQRAHLADAEKASVFADLRIKDDQLNSARLELRHLQERLAVAESGGNASQNAGALRSVLELMNHMPWRAAANMGPGADVLRWIHKRKDASNLLRDLRTAGVVDENADLTVMGAAIVRSLATERHMPKSAESVDEVE